LKIPEPQKMTEGIKSMEMANFFVIAGVSFENNSKTLQEVLKEKKAKINATDE
jgi:hypothetical protein